MSNLRILYNITVKIENSVADTWLEWMSKVHIPDMMATGKFEGYQINRILSEEPDGKTFAVQYIAHNMKALEEYQTEYAPALQKDHKEKFKDQYVAIRTLMEIVEAS